MDKSTRSKISRSATSALLAETREEYQKHVDRMHELVDSAPQPRLHVAMHVNVIAHALESYRDAVDEALAVVSAFKPGEDTRPVEDALAHLSKLGYAHADDLRERYLAFCRAVDEEAHRDSL